MARRCFLLPRRVGGVGKHARERDGEAGEVGVTEVKAAADSHFWRSFLPLLFGQGRRLTPHLHLHQVLPCLGPTASRVVQLSCCTIERPFLMMYFTHSLSTPSPSIFFFKVLNMDLLPILAFLLALGLSGTGTMGTLRTSLHPSLEIYKKMFEVKRREQLLALKNLAQLDDIHQQYKILDVMLKGLFKVLEDSRAVLVAADVLPDGPFPQDEKLKDAFSHVLENTAFFGDVVLRFPRIVHHYFDHNSNWNLLIRWGISFCNQTGVFDQGPHSPILGLMAQELGISEKESDFQNPFKVDHTEFIPSTDPFQKALREEEKRRKKEEKRKEIRKGPRISRSQSEL
ncbi:coiled-coil domain-containing protein 134 isoform X6 [Echinops telfairi]|uniref:Coiled-coil domain-containing protein 134 isoform X6 n=2 Tax=Echinops telfairi TaxID=9371 RepID=A0AC55D1R1_ECHTE|nr:coiled-coil domain-containing protein 134 isoform X6 [Echinops telfairi]